MQCKPYLFLIGKALHGIRFLSCLAQRRQKHTRKNRDDRNHDEELYQSENSYFHPAK